MFKDPEFDHFDDDLKNFNPEFHKNEDTLKITVSLSNSHVTPVKNLERRPLLKATAEMIVGRLSCQACLVLILSFISLCLKGRHVDAGANQIDYRVTIGGEDCPLIGPPATNAIICKPPREKPEGKPTKNGGVQVVVSYFNTEFI